MEETDHTQNATATHGEKGLNSQTDDLPSKQSTSRRRRKHGEQSTLAADEHDTETTTEPKQSAGVLGHLTTIGESIGWQKLSLLFVVFDFFSMIIWLMSRVLAVDPNLKESYSAQAVYSMDWILSWLALLALLVSLLDTTFTVLIFSERKTWQMSILFSGISGIAISLSRVTQTPWLPYMSLLAMTRLIRMRPLFAQLKEAYEHEFQRLNEIVAVEQKKSANLKSQAQQAISKWRSEVGTKERAEAMMEQYKQETETLREALYIASEEFVSFSRVGQEMNAYEKEQSASGAVPMETTDITDDELMDQFGEVYESLKGKQTDEHSNKPLSSEPFEFISPSVEDDEQSSQPATAPPPRKFVIQEDGTTSREA